MRSAGAAAASVLAASVVAMAAVGVTGCGAGDNGGTLGPSIGRATRAATPAGALHASLPARIAAAGRLRVGMVPGGFDADLAAALARVLGVSLVPVPVTSDAAAAGQLRDVGAGALDAAMSPLGDTSSVRATVAVDEIDDRRVPVAVLAPKANPLRLNSFAALCGHRVAVAVPSAAADLAGKLTDRCARSPLEPVTGDTEALARVQSGVVDAAIEERAAAQQVADDSLPPHEVVVAAVSDEAVLFGIAVTHADPALASALRDALAALMADGTYARLLARWGQPDAALAAAGIDGGG